LVHVAEKDIPPNSGLKLAPVGLENTIVLEQKSSVVESDILNILDIICTIELFQNSSLRSLRDMIQSSEIENYKEGEMV
jgi:hypothetical protein